MTSAPCVSDGRISCRYARSVTAVPLWPTRRDVFWVMSFALSRLAKVYWSCLGVHSWWRSAALVIMRNDWRTLWASSGVRTADASTRP